MDTTTLAAAHSVDFSLLALFLRATFTVKVVMAGLLLMSVWSWAIIIQKFFLYRTARSESAVFDRAFWSGEPLDELFDKVGAEPAGASEKIFAAGMLEWRRSHRQDGGLIAGAQARIDRAMDVAIARESEKLNKSLELSGHHRIDLAVHRAFRHDLGDQARFRADRDDAEHQPCRGGAGHRRGASGHGVRAWWRRCRLWSSTTSSMPTVSISSATTRASPTSSPPSCRASWTPERWARGSSNRAAEAGGGTGATAGARPR